MALINFEISNIGTEDLIFPAPNYFIRFHYSDWSPKAIGSETEFMLNLGSYSEIVLHLGEKLIASASINILEPFQIFKSKSFEISTSPLFTFELNFPKKVFLLNKNINLDYTSDVSSLNIDATLKYPNGNSEKINLPMTIKAEQIGTYGLNVQASKEGYKDVELKEQFAVIEGNVEIGQVESVNDIPNNLEKGEDKKISNLIWIFIILGILLFILIIFVIYFILKEKNI